ncbi:hypothetical protein [Thiomonas sp.]|jgi:hypothetical protein|uniref:hypothetical protein n=1 Tax=Thiomonas sp. TaxID=2047785 RepID=UPI0026390507|nr:hypothetical protein [Thiomonas sp.]
MSASTLLGWALELIAAGSVATFLIADSIPAIADEPVSGTAQDAGPDSRQLGGSTHLTT